LPFSVFCYYIFQYLHQFNESTMLESFSWTLYVTRGIPFVLCSSAMGSVHVLIILLFSGGDSADSVTVAVEGFEGDYGGVSFEDESGGFGTAFEGLNGAFGGGLDASEFGATTSQGKDKDLGGLGLLAGVSAQPGVAGQPIPSTAVDPKVAAELSGVDPNAGNIPCQL
jgi:hypothetical protein